MYYVLGSYLSVLISLYLLHSVPPVVLFSAIIFNNNNVSLADVGGDGGGRAAVVVVFDSISDQHISSDHCTFF